MSTSRRDFLRSVLGASSAALFSSVPAWRNGEARPGNAEDLISALPAPEQSGIEHVVVVMMENRSFDHLLGWLPNADGKQAGLTYLDSDGIIHETTSLAPDFTGCGHPDPDHSYPGGRTQYDGGAMDGFLRSGRNDEYSIGYYVEEDRPFFNALARNYLTFDRYFCSILGPTFPNRLFLHAAQTDRLSNSQELATMPTIWDRLAARRVNARYYFSNLPFLGLWGLKYLLISHSYDRFLIDAAEGTLPQVSFVDPRFTLLDDGTGNDDHPHADIRAGDAFLAQTFAAVASGPAWDSTVFIITYDEWGGFFDHVAPPRVVAPNGTDPDLVDGKALLGLRVPCVVASPFSRGGAGNPGVNGLLFDHTSVLKLIEWRWSLPPLTARDGSDEINNLAVALDFDNPNPDVPGLPLPAPPDPQPCFGFTPGTPSSTTSAGDASAWSNLLNSDLLDGWPVAR